MVTRSAPEQETIDAPAAEADLVIAGVCASAMGLNSLERLFSHLDTPSHAAYVVVMRQDDGIDPAQVCEALARQSGLPTEVVCGDIEPQAEHIYIGPADALMTFSDGLLRLEPAAESTAGRGSIDSFLISLAHAKREAAIGVLVAPLSSEGIAGVTALKESGGLALCEWDESRAQGDAHPLIDPSGLVDFILPAEKIAERITHYAKHLSEIRVDADPDEAKSETAAYLARIATVLRNRTGHDFHGYKHNTFLRRVQRRLQVLQIDEIEPYIEVLRTDPDEVGHLFQDLLIGVTQFFRDQPEFERLATDVIPKLFEGKDITGQFRVWVLGCATGEEAYSIAILLREQMAKLDTVPHIQIFATDIDGRALTMARAGRYPESIAKNVTPERLARWFTKEGSTYCVVKELREMCIFSQHNVIRDAPFSRMDLISCRNLLIYLNAELQDRVMPLFHFALRAGGYLFLGPSENVTRHAKLFAPIDRKHRIFRRIESGSRVLPKFPLSVTGSNFKPDSVAATPRRRTDPGLGRRAERIVERYAPAYVLIDHQFDVLNFSGRTGRFLEPAAGAANLNLLNLVHRDLRLDLRAALNTASIEKVVAKISRLHMEIDGEHRRVDLAVEPIDDGNEPGGYVVLFTDGGSVDINPGREAANASIMRDEHVQRLEGELRLMKERLQSTIEELESTNEELKSSNEEYQSINEELQSANEELETSKEELQSVNEELQTVNGELAHRVNELARANSDMKNLLESTQIATVFLDNDLRVKSFTPSVAEIFHLIDTDLGRPIVHIGSRVAYPELQDDVRRVLRTLATVEREVELTAGGARYLARVLPYRSVDNFIAGAVLTFSDITAVTKAESALRESEVRFRTVAELIPDLLWSNDTGRRNDWVNRRWTEYTGQSVEAASGSGWLDVIHPDDKATAQASFDNLPAGQSLRHEQRIRSQDGSYRWFLVQSQPLVEAAKATRWFGAATDIDDFKRAEERQKLLLAELQHRVKNILAVVRSIASRTVESSQDLEEFSSHFVGRLSALARTQSALARRGIEGVELEDLVREELVSHTAREGEQVEIAGPRVRLKEKAAEVFTLALHELATNAVKYGALASGKGMITVGWRVMNTSDGRRLSLEWRESGVPLLDATPRHRGFGRDLLERGLPYDLGAQTGLEFAPGGVRCTVEVPLSARVIEVLEADIEQLEYEDNA